MKSDRLLRLLPRGKRVSPLLTSFAPDLSIEHLMAFLGWLRFVWAKAWVGANFQVGQAKYLKWAQFAQADRSIGTWSHNTFNLVSCKLT